MTGSELANICQQSHISVMGHNMNLGNNRSEVECWKCGYKGHIQAKCCSKIQKKGWKGKKENDSKRGKDSSNIITEGEEIAFTTTFAGAMLAHNGSPLAKLEVNVYNCGASSDMSPAHKCFVLLTKILPCTIKAANQTLFTTTAMGKLWVSISNKNGTQKITQWEVLYCPNLAFTLVLLS